MSYINLKFKKYLKYKDYLKSGEWRETKKRVHNFGHRKECWICGKKKTHMHHLTYKRLGREKIAKDLVPLCAVHHKAIHEFAVEKNIPIISATKKYKKEWRKKHGMRWGSKEISDYFRGRNVKRLGL